MKTFPNTCLEIQVQREGKKPLVARFGAIPLKRQLIVTIEAVGVETATTKDVVKLCLHMFSHINRSRESYGSLP
jgi:hypothetical protein